MSAGLMSCQIDSLLSSVFVGTEGIDAAYGFGSYFRGEKFHDIDVVVVLSDCLVNPVAMFNLLQEKLEVVRETFGVRVDLTPLTADEFRSRPLLESDRLVPIFERLCAKT